MARSKADYLDSAEQAAAGQIDVRVEDWLIDEAGRYLVSMHQWPWLVRESDRLNVVANQPWIDLPEDFQQLLGLAEVDRLTRAVHETTLTHIDRLRGGVTVTGVTDWYVAIEWPGQPDTTSNPAGARLAIYPTPSSDDTDGGLRVRYRAGWVPLTTMDQVPNIPQDMESLLVQLVRAFTLGYVDEQRGKGSVTQRLEPIEQSTMVDRLKRKYGTAQANLGPRRGGIVHYPTSDGYHWHTNRITVNTTNS